MEFPNECRQNVARLQIEIVAGAIQVSGHQADSTKTVLLTIGLGQFDAGNFRDRILLVGWLQLPRQQVLLSYRLRRMLGINA